MSKVLMKGNEAVAKAAIISGCRYFFGYPITPQNEIPEYLSREMIKAGGTFVQAESEVAAINMVFGAAAAGGRVMTSSSSPGIALKQEGIGYIVKGKCPCVIVNMMRGGPALGTIQAAQQDYRMCVKGGANGDYHIIVLSPGSIQEAVDDVKEAFELADLYRMPVMVIADGLIGQMMEPVDFDIPVKKRDLPSKETWALGCGPKGQKNFIPTMDMDAIEGERKQNEEHLKYIHIDKTEAKHEELLMDDAEYAFVAYGTTARIVKNAISILREEGYKVGLIRPRTLWPFPKDAFKNSKIKKYLDVEMSLGQMVEDIALSVGDIGKVESFGRHSGVIPNPEEIADFARKVMGGAK